MDSGSDKPAKTDASPAAAVPSYWDQYKMTVDWMKYANSQMYGNNGWALAAAFALFLYALKDASHPTTIWFGTGAAILLTLFTGLTAAGWAAERDAAFTTLLGLESRIAELESETPAAAGQARTSPTAPALFSNGPVASPSRRKTLGLTYTRYTIYVITALFVLSFAVGGAAALIRLQSDVDAPSKERASEGSR